MIQSKYLGHVNVFDVKVPNDGLEIYAPIYLYHDEIAASAGLSVVEFGDMSKEDKVAIAGRWLAKRALKAATAYHEKLEALYG